MKYRRRFLIKQLIQKYIERNIVYFPKLKKRNDNMSFSIKRFN